MQQPVRLEDGHTYLSARAVLRWVHCGNVGDTCVRQSAYVARASGVAAGGLVPHERRRI